MCLRRSAVREQHEHEDHNQGRGRACRAWPSTAIDRAPIERLPAARHSPKSKDMVELPSLIAGDPTTLGRSEKARPEPRLCAAL
jgi:hypothetical protein